MRVCHSQTLPEMVVKMLKNGTLKKVMKLLTTTFTLQANVFPWTIAFKKRNICSKHHTYDDSNH